MKTNYDYPKNYDLETKPLKVIYSGYNQTENTICIETNEGDITIPGDEVAENILSVYDRYNIVYVVFWNGSVLENKIIEL